MDNFEKHWLRQYVLQEIHRGHDMKQAVKRISGFGFNPSTIRKYYKTFQPSSTAPSIQGGYGEGEMEKKGIYYMTLAISRVSPETPVILDAPDEIIQFFDGFFCEDNSFRDTWFKSLPLEPGVYHCRVDFYFEQGYFEGYRADGESDWEFVVTSAEQKIGFGKPSSTAPSIQGGYGGNP